MPILLRRDVPEARPMEDNVSDRVMTQMIGAVSLQGKQSFSYKRMSRIKDKPFSDASACSDKLMEVADSLQFDHKWRGSGFWRGKACTRLIKLRQHPIS
jgi:hypothetical protein